jgi:hypothetical protein
VLHCSMVSSVEKVTVIDATVYGIMADLSQVASCSLANRDLYTYSCVVLRRACKQSTHAHSQSCELIRNRNVGIFSLSLHAYVELATSFIHMLKAVMLDEKLISVSLVCMCILTLFFQGGILILAHRTCDI